jgi:NAD(P)-dependent dehydrogenase (short-subunit alcohol dehydrogenase family)
MSAQFENKVVLLTGAGSGIGRAAAMAFARQGAVVAVSDMRLPAAQETCAEIAKENPGARTLALALDVTRASDCEKTVADTEAGLGPIDVLVSNAGIGHAGTVLNTDEATWDLMMGVNAKGMFLMAKAVLPGMIQRGDGAIVNTASMAGLVAMPERAGYCASKFAVVGLTRALSRDHASQGVRVNCVCPGTIETPWIAQRLAQAEDPVATRAAMVARQPVGRMGTPEEVADAILYLASSRFCSGTALLIDGGCIA